MDCTGQKKTRHDQTFTIGLSFHPRFIQRGQDPCLSAVVEAMLMDAEGLKALTSVCEAVMRNVINK
jgi:hypothetical protein